MWICFDLKSKPFHFSSWIQLYLAPSVFTSTLTSCCLEEKHSHTVSLLLTVDAVDRKKVKDKATWWVQWILQLDEKKKRRKPKPSPHRSRQMLAPPVLILEVNMFRVLCDISFLPHVNVFRLAKELEIVYSCNIKLHLNLLLEFSINQI